MANAILAAKDALKLVLGVGRGSSGRLILDARDEQAVIDALEVVEAEEIAATGFTPGNPPESIEAAWLMMRYEHPDEDCESTILAVRDGDDWFEAGDWKAESALDSVYINGGHIVGWMPYAVPRAVLSKAPVTNC